MTLSIDAIRNDSPPSPAGLPMSAGDSVLGDKSSGIEAKPRQAPRAYLLAYLLAAGALALAAYQLVATPDRQPAPAMPAVPMLEQAPSPVTRPPESLPITPAHLASVWRSPAPPAEAPPPAPRFRLTRPPEIDNELLEAHARLEAHDLVGARSAYEQIIGRDPLDSGSLLALATIASVQGRDEEAATLRQRAFIADPGNPAAQAALLDNPAAAGEPVLAESRLKSLLARQAAPSLEFALGNLLARQRRWPEAQQAYFRAVAGDADNPDYLFNLAVSLEHLQQPRIAATYYRQALAASAKRASAFDRRQAEQRAGELADAGQP